MALPFRGKGSPPGTQVFGIIGDDRVHQARSPEVFNTVMQKAGIDGIYVPFEVKPGQIGEAIKAIRVLNLTGINVTVPFKETGLGFMDVLSEGANIIGAINTITREGDLLKGYNTNAIGFMNALENADIDPSGKSILVFGTGGAARAVVFMLNWLRAKAVYVVGRTEEKTQAIVDRVGGDGMLLSDVANGRLPVDMIVNATSVSSIDEPGGRALSEIVDRLDVPGGNLVVDLNYGRPTTFWRTKAKAMGADFLDGLPILAAQARRSLALWTGVEVPIGIFVDALGGGSN